MRRAERVEEGKADQHHARRARCRLRRGQELGPRHPRRQPVPPEQLGEHEGHALLERAGAGDAQDRRLAAPGRVQVRAPADDPGHRPVLARHLDRRRHLGPHRAPPSPFRAHDARQRRHQSPDRGADGGLALGRERAACHVLLRQPQALERHLVVVGPERPVPQELARLRHRLARVARQHALVEDLRRRERRPVAQHDVEEPEPVDVAAEDDEADGERRGEDEADGTPQEGPDRGREHDRHGRQPAAVPVDQGLQGVGHRRLDQEEQGRGPGQHRPARVDDRRHGGRERRGDEGADVGHEPQRRAQDAPERRARHADQPQARRDHQAEAGVDGELGEEEAAQAAGGVVDGRGRLLQVGRAGEADHPVPQVLALDQDEDGEDDDQARGRERAQERPGEAAQRLQRPRLRVQHLHRHGLARPGGRTGVGLRHRRTAVLEVLGHLLQHVDRPAERAGRQRGAAQRADLGLHRRAVLRQLGRELRHLARHHAAQGDEAPDGQEHHPDDRDAAGESRPLHEADQRGQQEAQDDGERDRDQDLAREVERRRDRQRQEDGGERREDGERIAHAARGDGILDHGPAPAWAPCLDGDARAR